MCEMQKELLSVTSPKENNTGLFSFPQLLGVFWHFNLIAKAPPSALLKSGLNRQLMHFHLKEKKSYETDKLHQ